MNDEFNSKECENFVKNVMSDLYGQEKNEVILITRHLISSLVMVMRGLEGDEFTNGFVQAAVNEKTVLAKISKH